VALLPQKHPPAGISQHNPHFLLRRNRVKWTENRAQCNGSRRSHTVFTADLSRWEIRADRMAPIPFVATCRYRNAWLR